MTQDSIIEAWNDLRSEESMKPLADAAKCRSEADWLVGLNSTRALTAFRSQPREIWSEIRTFEVPSATDFGHKSLTNAFYPNLFIDISETWHLKLEALKEYELEMKPPPHSRSMEGLENLAKYRGNQAGLNYAEAFEIIKKIDR